MDPALKPTISIDRRALFYTDVGEGRWTLVEAQQHALLFKQPVKLLNEHGRVVATVLTTGEVVT